MLSVNAIVILLLIVLFVILLVFLLIGSPLQTVNNLATQQVVSLGSYTNEVLLEGTNVGNSYFVMRPRSKGAMVLFWNNTSDDITILNDTLSATPQDNTVTIGTANDGVLGAQKSTVCLNSNGQSSSKGTSGSWLCQEALDFRQA